jgi:hypothetical protein
MRRQKTVEAMLLRLRRKRYTEPNETTQGTVRSGMIYALRWVLGADFDEQGNEMTKESLAEERRRTKTND